MIEYPRRGVYCIGFVTQDTRGPIQDAITEDVISIFLPTTPNPTSGFLLFVPKNEVYYLDVAVPEALKLIISGGAIIPEEGRGSYTTAAKLGINLKPAPSGKHSGEILCDREMVADGCCHAFSFGISRCRRTT